MPSLARLSLGRQDRCRVPAGRGHKRGYLSIESIDLAVGSSSRRELVTTKFAVAFFAVFCLSVSVMAEPLDCKQFRHNDDGSWTPIGQLTVTSPYGAQTYVGPRIFAGPGLANRLNQQCLTKTRKGK
jgi:hypothetical protein